MARKYFSNDLLNSALDWAISILIAVVGFILIRSFIFTNAIVSGVSMEPTFSHGEAVIVSKLSYGFSSPKRADVIAFPYSEDKAQHFIKRIIGLPGDEIELINQRFVVNGEPLQDDFDEEIYAIGDVAFPVTVPENSYFVLGDNRNQSKDSRYKSVGFVNKKDITGKVVFRIFPFNKLGGV